MSEIIKIRNKVINGSRDRQTVLDCYYLENQQTKPVVIFSHGFKGYKDWGCFNLMAEEFAKKGFVFIKFNFSYNGGTVQNPIDFPDLEAFSENNFSTELNDLGVVIDLLLGEEILAHQEFDAQKLSLIGHSRGGGISTLKAAQDTRIQKLITVASVSDFNYFFHLDPTLFKQFKEEGRIYIENSRTHQQMPIKYQLYEDYQNNKSILDIKENAKKIQIPAMVIHGTDDSSVNVKSAHHLHQWIEGSELQLIDEADHVFGAFQPYDLEVIPQQFQLWMDKAMEFLKREN